MTDPAPEPPDPLAVALSKLDPAPHGFDRDALMFAAGQASKMRVVMLWRAATVVAVLAAGVIATMYATRPPRVDVIERGPVITKPAP